jgi:hypothetical protein
MQACIFWLAPRSSSILLVTGGSAVSATNFTMPPVGSTSPGAKLTLKLEEPIFNSAMGETGLISVSRDEPGGLILGACGTVPAGKLSRAAHY